MAENHLGAFLKSFVTVLYAMSLMHPRCKC